MATDDKPTCDEVAGSDAQEAAAEVVAEAKTSTSADEAKPAVEMGKDICAEEAGDELGQQDVGAADEDELGWQDASAAEEDELYEIEVDEDDIYAYIVDEDDNEIGFILLGEDGEEEEYYYADEESVAEPAEAVAPTKSAKSRRAADDEEYDLGITREGVAEATADMNAIYKDGIQIAAELKSTFDDISAGFDFLKKK